MLLLMFFILLQHISDTSSLRLPKHTLTVCFVHTECKEQLRNVSYVNKDDEEM